MWISSKWRGGQSQAAGQRRSSLQRPSWVYLGTGKKLARAGQVRGLQGSSPGCLHTCTGEGRLAALPARRSPRGRCLAARKPFPAVFSLVVPGSPFLFFFFFFKSSNLSFFLKIAIEIKHPLGAIETAGRLCALQSLEHLVRLGPGCWWGAGEGCAPSRRRGLAAGRPRAEYLCYILKNLNK